MAGLCTLSAHSRHGKYRSCTVCVVRDTATEVYCTQHSRSKATLARQSQCIDGTSAAHSKRMGTKPSMRSLRIRTPNSIIIGTIHRNSTLQLHPQTTLAFWSQIAVGPQERCNRKTTWRIAGKQLSWKFRRRRFGLGLPLVSIYQIPSLKIEAIQKLWTV